ncbi:MAG: hypothetical protein HYX39_12540 [Bacteroidetes bacterium]|nr:hypothetical protein [Bacteroidota bacterium]
MTEKVLKEYFEGIASAATLSADLVGSVDIGRDTYRYHIQDFKSDVRFVLTSRHLIKLCNDVLNDNIKLSDLKTIASCLEFSQYFLIDADTTEGKRIQDIIFNWSSPEITKAKVTTIDYIKYCVYFLETGEHQ